MMAMGHQWMPAMPLPSMSLYPDLSQAGVAAPVRLKVQVCSGLINCGEIFL
jgi:hypothetical protein